MRVLDKFQVYFLKSFLKYLLYVTLLVLGIAYMVDVINHIDMAGSGGTVLNVMQYRLIRMPVAVASLIPVIVLVVFVVVVIIFQKYSEITAYLTVGGSMGSLLLPIAIFAVVVSLLTIALGEFLSPASRHWAEQYYASVFDGRELTGNEASNLFIVTESGDIDIIGHSDGHSVTGFVSVSFNHTTGNMDKVVRIARVDNIRGGDPITGVEYSLYGDDDGETPSITVTPTPLIPINTVPVPFIESTIVDIPTMSMSQLFASIRYDKLRGIDYTQKQYYLYRNLSYAISILGIIILLSPMIIGNPRGHSILSSGAKGIVIGMLYLLVVNNLMVITKTELITPFTGLILPHIVFAIGGGVNLVRRLRLG